ncbi:MAG: hypothetical protein FJ280_28240 [Planctomycetes bacterium]|nr:hypothetical protein [Planctomycetota bacterium]
MPSFLDRLAEAAERPGAEGRSLADRIRASYNPEWGTYSGFLVEELMDLIDAMVDEASEEEVRCAYNILAEQEGLEPLEEGEMLCGPWADGFVEAVMEEIGCGG